MPDVIAEQGALQDAIESPSTSVSRLGAAGWMKGKVADLNAIGVTENVSRLAAAGRIMGGIYDADPLATSTFFAPLLTTLVLSRGTGNPTFTRATTAYVKDFEDVWRQVPSGAARFEGARVVNNRCRLTGFGKSEDVSGWLNKIGATVTGTNQINFGGTAAARLFDSNTIMATTSTYTVRFKAKLVSGSQPAQLKCFGFGVEPTIPTLTSEYQTLSFTGAGSGSNGFGWIDRSGGAAFSINVTEIQLEDVTGQSNQNPSEYVSVGVLSAPYHGAGVDGVKYFDTENGNTVASNVVTEATGAAIADATLDGYLAEGQRQNRCLYSQDFTNAAWVSGGGGIAVTPNTAVAPDGTTTADTLTASGANGTLIQDLGVVASAAKAGGLFLKRKTGTGNIDLTLDGGATWTTVAVTSDWLMLEKTQTLADEDFGIRIVTSGDAVYAWQGQVETADFISSPIPTTTAAVTRNDDVLSYPSAGNISVLADYSMYAEWSIYADNNGNQNIVGSNLNYAAYFVNQTPTTSNFLTLFNNTGDSSAAFSLSGGSANVSRKGACARDSTNIKVVADGGTVVSASNGTETAEISTLYVGCNIGATQFTFGNIRNVKIWKTAKTDAQLQALTT